MRKADYATLANTVRKLRTHSQHAEKMCANDKQRSAYFYGKHEGLRLLALECADILSVDKAAFIRACGIE